MADDHDAFEQHPSVQDLLEAAQEHLAKKVVPALTDPRLRFETLVAAHVLGVAARELARGDGPARDFARGRAELPGAPASDAALCDLIDAGAFDGEAEGTALRAGMQARNELSLFAWNPLVVMRVTG